MYSSGCNSEPEDTLLRQMTIHERQLVRNWLPRWHEYPENRSTLSFTIALIASLLYIVMIFTIDNHRHFSQMLLYISLGIIPIVAVSIGLIFDKLFYNSAQIRIKPLHGKDFLTDIDVGKVSVSHYSASGAVQVQTQPDDSPALFIQICDNTMLFLHGKYLIDPIQQCSFPSKRFDLIRLPVAGNVLGIELSVDHIQSSTIRIMGELDWDRLPRDGECVNGHIETVNELIENATLHLSVDTNNMTNTWPKVLDNKILPIAQYNVKTNIAVSVVAIIIMFSMLLFSVVVTAISIHNYSTKQLLFQSIIPLFSLIVIIILISRLYAVLRCMDRDFHSASFAIVNCPAVSIPIILKLKGEYSSNQHFTKKVYLVIPSDFAASNHLPEQLLMYPPSGIFFKRYFSLDIDPNFSPLNNEVVVFQGIAELNIGPDGMVVISTNKGDCVRILYSTYYLS